MCPSLCISVDFCFKILCNSFSTLQVSPTCCSKDFHSLIPSYAKSYLLLLNLNLLLATLFDVPSSYSGRDNEHRHKSLSKAHLRWTQSLLWVCPSRICRAVAFKGKRGPSWPQELKAEKRRGQIKVFNIHTAEEIFISSYPSNGSCRKGLAHAARTGPQHAIVVRACDLWVIWLHTTASQLGRKKVLASWHPPGHQPDCQVPSLLYRAEITWQGQDRTRRVVLSIYPTPLWTAKKWNRYVSVLRNRRGSAVCIPMTA